ncbi:MAG: PD-(D/E)XK nuclease family protein, partial [Gemmatimonadales bacterium]
MWATSVAKVLSGEVTCEWAYWFKAHFKHDKRESGDWTMTQAAHMEMVRRWADDLVERGYSVRLEGQNAFHATGTKATVGVRPDLVAVRGTELRILDCKTGASRGWHRFQVLLYMLL